MSTAAEKTFLTPEQYLAIEERSEVRHEYYRGEMFAMAGATREHILVAGNIARAAGNQLEGGPCEVYQSEMRVRVNATGLYTYPDVAVVCAEPRFADPKQTTLLNPIVLFEVLSKSTEAYDRGTKFDHYQAIESLREFVLVAQDRPRVELFRRGVDEWIYTRLNDLGDVLTLESVDIRIPLASIYARVAPSDPQPRPLRAPFDEDELA